MDLRVERVEDIDDVVTAFFATLLVHEGGRYCRIIELSRYTQGMSYINRTCVSILEGLKRWRRLFEIDHLDVVDSCCYLNMSETSGHQIVHALMNSSGIFTVVTRSFNLSIAYQQRCLLPFCLC